MTPAPWCLLLAVVEEAEKCFFLFKIQTFYYTYIYILAKCVPTVKTNTINNLQGSSKKPVLDIWSTLPLQVDTAGLVSSPPGGPVLCRLMSWLLQLRIIQFSYKCRVLMFYNLIKCQNILTYFSLMQAYADSFGKTHEQFLSRCFP